MKTRLLFNLIAAALLLALTADYGGKSLELVDRLEKTAYDWRLLRDAKQARRKNADIVIIDIDRDSLRSLGSWPWNRDLLAKLLNQLFERYGVLVAAFSFPFPDTNDDTLAALKDVDKRLMMSDDEIAPETREQLEAQLRRITQEYDYDSLFADSMRNRAVLLSYVFDESGRRAASLPAPSQLLGEDSQPLAGDDVRQFPYMQGYSGNIKKLNEAAAGGGHINLRADSDGLVRSVPMIVRNSNDYYESLAFALMRFDDISGSGLPLVASGEPAEKISTGRYAVNIDEDSTMLLRFGNIGGRSSDFDSDPDASFRYISARDIIRGRAQEEHLKNKIVVIGSSSELLRDLHPTPVNPVTPKAEIIAAQIASARADNVLFRSPTTRFVELLALVAAAVVLSVAAVFIGPLLGFVLTVLFSGGFVWFVFAQWSAEGEVFRLVPPLVVFAGIALVNALSGFVFEWTKGRQLKSAFSQYVPPELAQQVGKTINMEGESREISVLFSDIRNFTSISEKLTPQELTSLMNRMLTAQTRVIHENRGTVDKFIGDAVMAFWNAPLDDEEHALHSVQAAMGMQKAIQSLSAEEEKAGRKEMRLGVGICTGVANVGNMGSEFRVAYTALGDTVNVSSRVEGLTKYYGVPILVTQSTRDKCGESYVFRVVDVVRVKGREQALKIHEPVGAPNLVPVATTKALEMYEKMRLEYVKGEFAAAMELLRQYDEERPGDGLTAFYRRRIEMLLKSPPGDAWDGITVFESK